MSAPASTSAAAPDATGAALSWWPAPAKLNLFLHVVGRERDGYHSLQTLFQLIDLCDRIGLAVRSDGRIERPVGMCEVAVDKDLTVRAARRLQQHAQVGWGAEIHVIKRIPSGGGLGGGSSDAATVLVALNRLWGCGLAPAELAALGLGLGADVPVFVHGLTAWGEGRGERLQGLPQPPLWYLVVHPGVAVSTAQIFQAPELTRNSPLITIRDFSFSGTRNDCEPVVRRRYGEVDAALSWLEAALPGRGAVAPVRMTGTGSCIFVPFERSADAERVAARVPEPWTSFVARGLDRSPLHERLQNEG